MRLRLRSFATAKHGNRLVDCEDAAAASEHRGRFAIADGASQSWAARDWARLLTDRWLADPAAASALGEWLTRAQQCFDDADQTGGAAVPAYLRAQRSERQGVAHATFVGASVALDGQPLLQLTSAGDSCGFVVRDSTLFASVPPAIEHVVFDSTPALVMSCGPLPEPIHHVEVTPVQGDRCYLATDALAEVLRDTHFSGRPLWDRLDGLGGASFLDLVEELRREGMENDDVALIVAHFE